MAVATSPETATNRKAHRIGDFAVTPKYVVDLRDQPPDLFQDHSPTDWRKLTWRDVGRPEDLAKLLSFALVKAVDREICYCIPIHRFGSMN